MIKKIFTIISLLLLASNPAYTNENNILSIGSNEAQVTIKVFSSLTCPHCASFHNKIFKVFFITQIII